MSKWRLDDASRESELKRGSPDKPPAWFLPVREMLGGALMKQGEFAAAERVFRDDLQRNRPMGGHCLD